jgi:hypothetical protein
MKSFLRKVGVVFAAAVLVGGTASSQDLKEQLSKLGFDAATKYTTPLLQGFGSNLNSAFYHSADLHSVLGFDVGIKFAVTTFEDVDKTYSLDLPPSMTYNGVTFTRGTHYPASVTSNTAIGENTNTEVKTTAPAGPGGIVPAGTTILTLPGGFNIPGVPLVMPQASIGLPFGLEVVGRFVPTISAGDAGKFSYTGFGLRYDVDQWLPLFPVDIAVHFMTQSMNFKASDDSDIFSASASAYGVEVSKRLIFITAYAGFQLESSTMSLASFSGYDPSTGTTVTVPGFDVEGKNSSRVTVGLRMLLLIVNVHAEYSLAANPTMALGVGLSIR